MIGNTRFARHRGVFAFDSQRPTVLVVSHEASITGAPILALNICKQLSSSCNVVALLLKGGGLVEDFQECTVQVVELYKRNPVLAILGAAGFEQLKRIAGPALRRRLLASLGAGAQLNQRYLAKILLKELKQACVGSLPKYALVNSVVSAPVIGPLRSLGIAPITLIHEFTAYIRPIGLINSVALLSSELVFSSNLTSQDAIKNYPQLRSRRMHVLPQGHCERPSSLVEHGGAMAAPNDRASLFLSGLTPDTILILGAGAVQPRKGVDLFISVADQMRAHCPDLRLKFAWIGSGYDPINDFSVGLWLSDQIDRSGLENQLYMFDQSPAYDSLLERADIFLLSSRLDPLPNVAIDALLEGKPVLCFDRACGIADLLLSDEKLGDSCVAPYLNTAVMARQAAALVNDRDHRLDVADRVQKLAQTWFSMPQYISTLQSLGERAADDLRDMSTQLERLIQFDAIDWNYNPQDPTISSRACTEHYLLSWRNWSVPRKPFPGFHPGIYRNQRMAGQEKIDPLLHYLEAGQPSGPWNAPLILPGQAFTPIEADVRVALHIHVHYPELLGQMIQALASNQLCPDLFITCSNPDQVTELHYQVGRHGMRVEELLIVPNRGRDIGPLITELGRHLNREYAVYGHLHTKKSVFLHDTTGSTWRDFLVANLLGDSHTVMADRIVSAMNSNPSLGLVFPDDPYCVGWSANHDQAALLAQRLGLTELPEAFNFPIGTMFWARQGALSPLYELGLEWNDYPLEPLAYDGTILHAIERILPLICESQGYSYSLTHVPGVNR
jgi:hypothetical protein